MRAALLIAAVCIAALIGFQRPAFGLMTFAFLGFFNPHGYTWGIGRTFPLSQLVAISTILGMFLSPGQKRLPVQRETILLMLLWGVFGVSTFFAIFPDDAGDKFTEVSKILLMVGVATIVINSEEKLYSLIRVIGYSLGFYGLKGGVFAIATGGAEMVYGPENSFLNSNNSTRIGPRHEHTYPLISLEKGTVIEGSLALKSDACLQLSGDHLHVFERSLAGHGFGYCSCRAEKQAEIYVNGIGRLAWRGVAISRPYDCAREVGTAI